MFFFVFLFCFVFVGLIFVNFLFIYAGFPPPRLSRGRVVVLLCVFLLSTFLYFAYGLFNVQLNVEAALSDRPEVRVREAGTSRHFGHTGHLPD